MRYTLLIALLLASPYALAQDAPTPPEAPPIAAPKLPKPVAPDAKLSATLTYQEWTQIIFGALPELPGKFGNPLSETIQRQLAPQVNKLQFPD